MSTTLLWSTFEDADCNSFNLYRAITGFIVEFPNTLAIGDQLKFSATSPTPQTVTLTGATIDDIRDDINEQAKGIKATKSQSGTELFIRCTANESAKLKLLACSFLTKISETPRLITPRSEFELLVNVPRISGTFDYEYLDPNGDAADWYRITSVSASVESIPSLAMQALPVPDNLCVVEGRVTDLQNRPIVGAEIRVKSTPPVATTSNTGIVFPEIVATTDSYGRWSIPLLQNQSVLFRIPAISYNEVVQIPEERYVLFKDLVPNNNHWLAPEGEPVS